MMTVPMTELRMVRTREIELPRRKLFNAEHVVEVAYAAIGHHAVEHMVAFMLGSGNAITSVVTVAIGGMSGACLSPSDVLRSVLMSHANGFILAHNHPSGDPSPSREDIAFTAKIHDASKIVGVPLLDHVIVTSDPNTYASIQL